MLDFSNAKLLSYTQRNDFLGENFRYGTKKELTVEGSIYNLGNAVGVAVIWSGISGLVSGMTDYDAIILNGVNFGSGRINQLQFKEGIDVQKKDYTANITIWDTGNLFNMTGQYYNGLNFNDVNSPIYLVDNFNENFDFSIRDDGSYTYKQNVSVKFISGKTVNNKSAIEMARNLASGLFFSTPAFGFIDSQHSGWYTQSGRRTYAENYNLITNECSFSENFELDFPSGNYSVKYAHEINTDERGVTNVTENGRIRGLYPDYYLNAENGYQAQQLVVFNRCNGVMNFYFPTGYALAGAHLSQQKKIDKINGEINYAITFTNDPNFNINYTWDYTQEADRVPNSCFYRVKENGKIKGLDNSCLYTARNDNALAAWATIQTGLGLRATGFYQSSTSLSNTLKLISSSKRHNPYLGTIDYDTTYADDLYYGISPGIKKVDYSIEDNKPVIKANKFGVLNVREVVQKTSISTEGNYTLNIKVIGERGTSLDTCLDAATTIAALNKCSVQPNFISHCTYSFIPYESSLDFTVGWTYIQNVGDKITI